MTLSAAALATGLITVVALNASSQTPAPAPAADFVRDVRPILESRCYECHGPKKAKGRLRLDLKASAIKGGLTGPAVIPGNADDSLLVRRVLGLDGEDRMPKDKDPLPDAQVSLLRAWIAQGAAWPDDGPDGGGRSGARGGPAGALGVPAAGPSDASCRLAQGLGPKSHRSVRRRPPGEGRTRALARGVERGADPPRVAGPRRPAADARGDRRLRRRHRP